MKNLIAAFLLVLSMRNAFSSDITTCRADILSSICGTGKVEILIDSEKMTYQLHYGDVACWFAEIQVEGKLVEIRAPHHLLDSKKFGLITGIGEIEIGQLIYRSEDTSQKALAQLSVISNKEMASQGALFGRFNLTCSK